MQLDINGRIRTIDKTRNNGFGETVFYGNSFDIKLALNNNKALDEFSGTLLHEMLHVYFRLVKKLCHLKVTATEEHEIIKGIESVVMYFIFLNLESRKK